MGTLDQENQQFILLKRTERGETTTRPVTDVDTQADVCAIGVKYSNDNTHRISAMYQQKKRKTESTIGF
jgi:hypothetical protein